MKVAGDSVAANGSAGCVVGNASREMATTWTPGAGLASSANAVALEATNKVVTAAVNNR